MKDFIMLYEYNQINFYDEDNKKYKGYSCRKCKEHTPHTYIGIEKENAVYECYYCGTRKTIYVGLRKLPERRMM